MSTGHSVTSTKRILVIEDNPDLAYGLRNNLEIEGYEGEVATDGTQGLSPTRAARRLTRLAHAQGVRFAHRAVAARWRRDHAFRIADGSVGLQCRGHEPHRRHPRRGAPAQAGARPGESQANPDGPEDGLPPRAVANAASQRSRTPS